MSGKQDKRVPRTSAAAAAPDKQPAAAGATLPAAAAPAPSVPRDRQFDPIRNPLGCFSEQTGASFG